MVLLLLLPSPSLMAITMGQIKAGVAGSSSGGGGRGAASNLQGSGGASADLTAALARSSIQKSNELLAALAATQDAAHAAAKEKGAADASAAASAPNGLKNGWLEPHVVGGGSGISVNGTPNTTSWSGASINMAKTTPVGASGNHHVEITQTAQNAYLYWNHFNVGAKTTVNFDQGQAENNAIAFNKVMTATAPSHIFGAIKAQGQVFIQNQNGILFHNGSEVNVRALVASTLPINENLAGDALKNIQSKGTFNTVDFSRWGKLNNANNQNLFTLGDRTAAKTGDIVVEKGARINATGPQGEAGMVALVAPNVRNDAAPTISAQNKLVLAGERVQWNPDKPSATQPDVASPGKVVTSDGGLYKGGGSDQPSSPNLLDALTPEGNLVMKLDGLNNVSFRPDAWSGAYISSPLFSKSMEITQTAQNAYLSWSRFSPAFGMSLALDQSAGGADVGKWIAFIKVTGSDASSVGGSLTAQGQIYLLNQNGITFEGGSSANAHALVASALPINENLAGSAFQSGRGIANNPDYQFLFTALHVNGDAQLNTASFDPVITAQDRKLGDVVVSSGASIFSPADASHTGGLVALIGANVLNAGLISTPNGQTVLASGLQVGLTPHAEPSLRGMNTYVGALKDDLGAVSPLAGSAGETMNNGIIQAMEGNITMAGGTVLQKGALLGGTSTGLNGRVDIAAIHDAVANTKFTPDGLNGSFLSSSTAGQVILGPKSLIRILPEWEDTTTKSIGSSLALNSVVTLSGADIHFGSESVLLAPGAAVTQGATGLYGEILYSGVAMNAYGPMLADTKGVMYSSGKISLDEGAILDVAGSTGIEADSSEYMLQLQLRGPELANSPLQRGNNSIRGKTITIDSRITGTYDGREWVGTPLGDATGYPGLVQRTVGELTTAGGSLAMFAGDSVSVAEGSKINVSGGWVRYSGGDFATTKLIGPNGKIYDISAATPDLLYSGILKDVPKTYEAPYLSGASGGALSIQAPSLALDGDLHGVTVTGFRQVRNQNQPGTPPAPSSLAINLQGQALLGNAVLFTSRYAPDVLLGSSKPVNAASGSVFLNPALLAASGFGNLSILNNDGLIKMEKGSVFDAGLGGSLNLEGANLDLAGSIIAPGGSVRLAADLIPMELSQVAPVDTSIHLQPLLGLYEILETGEKVYQYGPAQDGFITILHSDLARPEKYGLLETVSKKGLRLSQTGNLTLHAATLLSTAGLVTSDFLASTRNQINSAKPDGGTMQLSGYNVSLGGAVLDVSGGVHQAQNGAVAYGNGGSLAVSAGVLGTMTEGSLDFGQKNLMGFGGYGMRGGSLQLSSQAFAIGSGITPSEDVIALDPGFFNLGGFSSFSLTGTGLKRSGSGYRPGVELLAGTSIHPIVSSAILNPLSGLLSLSPFLAQAPYRPASSITFQATGVTDLGLLPEEQLLIRGDVVLNCGSSITLDPGLTLQGGEPSARMGSAILKGQTVSVAGTIYAPGGTIQISSEALPENVTEPTSAKVTLDLTPEARLLVSGLALYGMDPKRIRGHFGSVLSGGSISLQGNLLAQSGSVLDVSGGSGILDLFPYQLGNLRGGISPVRIDSDGGKITMKGSQSMRSDATLLAHAGGPTALGGTLSVSSGRFYGPTDQKTPSDLTLSVVSQGGVAQGLNSIGQGMPNAAGVTKGGGVFSASSLLGAGFENVTLGGNVFFSGEKGPVSITVPGALSVATKGILASDTIITLNASYASLGTPFAKPLTPLDFTRDSVLDPVNKSFFAPPAWGAGELVVHADLIDLGNLSLLGIGKASFEAGRGGLINGTIRGDGSFVMAGELTFAAGMIYPSSGTTFTVVAFHHDADGNAVSESGDDVTPGSITLQEGIVAGTPLSTGGKLAFYSDSIVQSGNLFAPYGQILLGSGASKSKDPMSGLIAPLSSVVTLSGGSVTSVSGIDLLTGKALSIPFGTSVDGTSWIDLSGTDISSKGLPDASVTITGNSLNILSSSRIDLRGGGEITANRWVSGLGGKIDYLSQPNSYAIVPGYQSSFAPTGYNDAGLSVGSRINLSGGGGLPAGTYTLLPGSYATQPGAYLLTALPSGTIKSGVQPDGSYVVAGTRINALDPSAQASPLAQAFRLDTPSVLASRVQYDVLKADAFFTSLPSSSKTADAASLKLQAGDAMVFQGSVKGTPGVGGRGAFVDLSGALNFRIVSGNVLAAPGTVVIDASVLNGLDAGSLLIGGVRNRTSSGFEITSEAMSVSLDPKVTLQAPELILTAASKTHVAQSGDNFTSVSAQYDGVDAKDLARSNPDALLVVGQTLTIPKGDYPDYTVGKGESLGSIASTLGVKLADLVSWNTSAVVVQDTKLRIPGFTASVLVDRGASITASGTAPAVAYTISGDGALMMVSASPKTTLSRSGFLANAADASGKPFASLAVSGSTKFSGGTILLDSTANGAVNATSTMEAQSVAIRSGKITLDGGQGNSSVSSSLRITGGLLNALSRASTLELTSYSSLNLINAVSLGATDPKTGKPQIANLTIHAGSVTGDGSDALITAGTMRLDNANGSTPSAKKSLVGTLSLNADILESGKGNVLIRGFQTIRGMLSQGFQGAGVGGISADGGLTLMTPLVTSLGGAITSLSAGGDLKVLASPFTSSLSTKNLGGAITFTGGSVSLEAPVVLNSGSVVANAQAGDLNITSLIDVSGSVQAFKSDQRYTDAGKISLSSEEGDITFGSESVLNLSAPVGGGNAGALEISTPLGSVNVGGRISAAAPSGVGGSVSVDLASYDGGNLGTLTDFLTPFTLSQNLRVRTGDVTLSDATAHHFSLSADDGSITVNGMINASGKTGGSISLYAGKSLTLADAAQLSVHGKTYDAAGKGGSIDLEAGNSSSAVIASSAPAGGPGVFAPGVSVLDLGRATLDLGVDVPLVAGKSAGTLLLKAPQTGDSSDLQINPLLADIRGFSSITAIGNHRLDASRSGTAAIDKLPLFGALPLGLPYLPGQSVVSADNGAVYQLTVDPAKYAKYVATEVAGDNSVDPAGSTYWKAIAALWDESGATAYAKGTKIYNPADGLVYTALSRVLINEESPIQPGVSSQWALQNDDGNLQASVLANAASFTESVASSGNRFAGSYKGVIQLQPGEEIVNSKGGLVLNSDWDLSLARFGSQATVLDGSGKKTSSEIGTDPGLLTLRAVGDVTFRGALTDGFGNSSSSTAGLAPGLYKDSLLPLVDSLGSTMAQRSWSYRIIAGADLKAANALNVLDGAVGNVSVGVPFRIPDGYVGGAAAPTLDALYGYYQPIRTGAGSIDISSSGDLRIWNDFSTIYTAGSRVLDPTMGGRFDIPSPDLNLKNENLGFSASGYAVQFSQGGGNVAISAGRDITRLALKLDPSTGGFYYDASGQSSIVASSVSQMPSNWLLRRGAIDPATGLFLQMPAATQDPLKSELASTAWWIDFSNFFQGVGALGGGNVTMNAGRNVANVDAVIPSNFRMPSRDAFQNNVAPDVSSAVELGGGDLSVTAGNNIDAGVYYVEKGKGALLAGGSIVSNPTRDTGLIGGIDGTWGASLTDGGNEASAPEAYLPTTLFQGKGVNGGGGFSVKANGDVLLGPVANAFLMPQSINNGTFYSTYFSTYDSGNRIDIASLNGDVLLREGAANNVSSGIVSPLLQIWMQQMAYASSESNLSYYQPWIRSSELNMAIQSALFSIQPPTLDVSTPSGSISVQGNLTLSPASRGNLAIFSSGGISGYTKAGFYNGLDVYAASVINLSDADPSKVPGTTTPLSRIASLPPEQRAKPGANSDPASSGSQFYTDGLGALFSETGSSEGVASQIEKKLALHDQNGQLHANDANPLTLTALGGAISGMTLFSSKRAMISAGSDISDVGFYIQNVNEGDISVVSAGGTIKLYDPLSAIRSYASLQGEPFTGFPSGDLQISGPGSLEVLAGSSLDLGNQTGNPNDSSTWNGITSVGNTRNPGLTFQGADLVLSSGISMPSGLTSDGAMKLQAFSDTILSGDAGDSYLKELKETLAYSGLPDDLVVTKESMSAGSGLLTDGQRALLQTRLFYLTLRDTGRGFNNPNSPNYRSYEGGRKAIAEIFGSSDVSGSITAWSRDIRTKNGGDISILAPGGGVTLAKTQPPDTTTTPGIVTEHGGSIDIFTRGNVELGIGRIFTLRGGDIMIWSDQGNIAAGSSAKTVASAPPARVLFDPQSGDVVTDLAGLATGGGIGVLDTVAGVLPGNVDLIAPSGFIDAGDAGIRSAGNLTLAAPVLLNTDNLGVKGLSIGAPPPPAAAAPAAAAPAAPAAPPAAAPPAANTAAAANNSAADTASKNAANSSKNDQTPSIFTIDVLGYGGDASEEEENKKAAAVGEAPIQASL